jgi:hypothetical protein
VAGGSNYALQFLRGKYAGEEFALDPGRGAIAGRSSEADLVLADDAVSRKHARLYHHRGRPWIRDLGSKNGTRINGKLVERHCLREGDRLVIGSNLAKVIRVETSQASEWKTGRRTRGAGREDAAESGASRSMSGSIEDIPLVDVLQWLATSRKTGALRVRAPSLGRTGAVHLRDGQVFFATIEGASLHPEKALLRMLSWAKGMFELDASAATESPAVELQTSLEHMLMEAARQQDEMANLTAKRPLPALDGRVTLVHPSPVRWKDLAPPLVDLVQSICEFGPEWGPILDRHGADDLTTSRNVVELAKLGVVTY